MLPVEGASLEVWMQVRFWGVRGSFPVPGPSTHIYGGNTSCVQVNPGDGTIIIIDAGTGIRRLGQALMNGPCGIGQGVVHLLISHTHWDHIQGLPFFAPLYQNGNRIEIYARQRNVNLKTIFSSQSEDPYFSVSLDEIAALVRYTELIEGAQFRIGDAEISCTRLNHPYIAIGYRISAHGRSLAYVSDTAPFDRIVFEHQFIAQRPDSQNPPPKADAIKLDAMRQGVLELCRGCDLIIFDTMFRFEEYQQHPHWGHSSPEHAVEIAEQAGAAALALFHHAPGRTDKEIEEDLRTVQKLTNVEVIAAAEDLALELNHGVRRIVTCE